MPQSIHTFNLPNGLTIVVEPMPHLRSAAWTLLIDAGSATDPDGQSGAMELLNGMLYRGAGERDARALSNALDDLGVQRGGGVSTETTTLSGALLADDLPAALAIYADIAQRPQLPADEIDAERALALQAIQSLNDNPSQKLFVELSKIYFPGPFGRSTLGEPDELQRVDYAALKADHAARFRPQGAVLAVAGGVDPEQVRATVEQYFGNWQGSPPPMPQPQVRTDPLYQHVQQDTNQTQIAVAYGGYALEDPHYYHDRLALNVLSGGMGARLFTEVREKRGLVYSVFAAPRTYKGLGLTMAYAGTQPERAQETTEVLLNELRRISEGVTQAELTRARTGLLASLVMQGESSGARARAMASDMYLIGRARTLEEIRAAVDAITLDELNNFLANTPPPAFTVLTLGPSPVEVA